MKKNYIKRFLTKLIVFIYFLLNPITSFAEIGDKQWSKICNANKQCAIMIVKKNDKKQNISTATIQLRSSTKKEMALIDGEKTNKLLPVLVVKLPLNVSLKKSPLLRIDKKGVLKLPFLYCNTQDGCVASSDITDEILKLLKEGNILTVTLAVYGSKNFFNISFPLKGFSKSYKSLLK